MMEKEYLNYLNFSLGSCGEFHSCYESFHQAVQISDDEYEELDSLHYKVENELIRLIESLKEKNLVKSLPIIGMNLYPIGAFFGDWQELQLLFEAAGKSPVIPDVLLPP